MGLVKSVEILRGPGSALYGSDGLAGVVSFTTSDPADFLRGNGLGGLARAAYSSADDEFAETAILAAGGGGVSGMVAYTRRDYGALENQGTNTSIGARAHRAQSRRTDARTPCSAASCSSPAAGTSCA
ncbi:MAG: TonB-dependent receptor plug domain-containing protein [Sphingomonas sp.]